MIFLNPTVILEKIQRNDSLARNIKSFIASLAIYVTLAMLVLHFTADHTIQLPKPEEKITISLAEFASTSGDIDQTKKSQPNNNPSKPIAKPRIHKNVSRTTPSTTLEKIPSQSPMVSSEESALLAPSRVAPSILPSPLTDSPHLNVSPETKNELQRSPHSSNEIGGATLGQIRAMIENAVTYPAIARKLRLEGVVMVFFVLKQDGTVQTAKVVTTSGSDILDKKAIQTILSLSGQYPALGKTFELSIPIAFSLKKS